MASIMKNNKQEEALSQINADLETIKQINAAIDNKAAFQIITTQEKGKGLKLPISADEEKAVIAILDKIRGRLAKGIRAKAKKFSIELDEADEQILKITETR